MREIKFRAWDKEQKQMWYQDKMFFTIGVRRGQEGSEVSKERSTVIDNFFTPCQGNLMQYTGLKDKNGVEIYEGDIVLLDECEYCEKGESKVIAQIVFKDGAFLYHTEDVYWHSEIVESDATKIIGNIYENPELIK